MYVLPLGLHIALDLAALPVMSSHTVCGNASIPLTCCMHPCCSYKQAVPASILQLRTVISQNARWRTATLLISCVVACMEAVMSYVLSYIMSSYYIMVSMPYHECRSMGSVKPQLAADLLRRGRFTAVVLSDTDTAWLRDPKGLIDMHPLADIMVSTDCLSHEAEAKGKTNHNRCGHTPGSRYSIALNTGVLVFTNSTPALAVLDRWHKVRLMQCCNGVGSAALLRIGSGSCSCSSSGNGSGNGSINDIQVDDEAMLQCCPHQACLSTLQGNAHAP